MNNNIKQLSSQNLMKRILKTRFTNAEEVQRLCEQLLVVAETKNDSYSSAFANLYLLDCHYIRGHFDACCFYLQRTQTLCESGGYENLLLIMHNIAGLYYQDLYDEQSAMKHYLKGLHLAKKLNNPLLESKVLNNMGICFQRRHDNSAAAVYFRSAYKTLAPHISDLTDEEKRTLISFLCNLAEARQYMKNASGSKKALTQAAALNVSNQYYDFHQSYGWCGHYAMCQDRERSIAIAEKILDDGLDKFEHFNFKTSAFMELTGYMLDVECQELALRYLQLLESCCSYSNLGDYYNCQVLKIRYYERFGTSEECNKAYREFYEISVKINETDDAMRVQNALSKIELTQALLDREEMRRENKELEDASHIDELTQLYNRRYLSKLSSKVTLGQENISLGYIMLDVDYFKQYNDFYGHFKGDGALQCVAEILRARAAAGAYASRYGGDEFLVLCVNWSDRQIEAYVQQIRADLADRKMPHERSLCSEYLTLSIGVSNGFVKDTNSLEVLLKLADQALYEAKKRGRNCVEFKNSCNPIL